MFHVHLNSGAILRQFIAMVFRQGLTGCQASPLKTPTATPIDEQAVSRMCACGKELWRDFGWPQGELSRFRGRLHLNFIIVELRTPAMPVGIGGGKERGGCHLNLRTWHAEGRWPILGLCWPSLGLCWPILRLCWPTPMRTKCCKLQHFALWDGKNPCKYHSLSPRKWLKHSYWQSLVHITIVDFLKNV